MLRHNIHRKTLYQLGLDAALLLLVLSLGWPYRWAGPLVAATGVLCICAACGMRLRRLPQRRVLVLGSGPRALRVGRLLQQVDPQVQLVGYYAGAPCSPAAPAAPDLPLFRRETPLATLVQQEQIGEIVIGERAQSSSDLPLRELLVCKQIGVHVLDASAHFEQTLGQIRREPVCDGWLNCEGFEQRLLRRCSKRLLDLLASTLLLLPALPLMAAAALLIRLDSPGPALFRQERVGLHGRSFAMLKFRSMRTDAEQDGQPRWACSGDARITRAGRFLRRHHIDELPQLFNVLIGQMSLVGPRPERPCFVATLAGKLPHYDVRHCVKPGITGWAQVRFRYGASVGDAAEKLQYDLYYVKNQCLLLDLVVLFDTVGVVLTGRGAH